MLRTAGELKGVTIEAMDGDIGSVQDLYFDDQTWTIRYLVVDTGTWLPGRQVLISPFAFQVVPGASRLRTSLTKDQIEEQPVGRYRSPGRSAARRSRSRSTTAIRTTGSGRIAGATWRTRRCRSRRRS